jgi:hypothetical protein
VLFESLDPYGHYAPPGLIHNLGYVALHRGDLVRSTSLFAASADAYRTVGTDRRGLAECIIGLACTAARAGHVDLAARLFGAAEAELERLGMLLTATNRAEFERGVAALEAVIGRERLASVRATGRSMSLDNALEEARATFPA